MEAAERARPAAVVLEGVDRAYPRRRGGPIAALEGLSLRVGRGEVLGVGPSGCGKPTLLELVCALQAPAAGRVEAPPAVLMPHGPRRSAARGSPSRWR